jgi:hypothetical protein
MTNRIGILAATFVALFAGTAAADAPYRTATAIEALSRVSQVDRGWAQPDLPSEPTRIPAVALRALELGNDALGYVGFASADLVALEIDAPNRGVKVAVGGGNARYAQLRVSSDIAMVDGAARIATRVRLGVANQSISFRVPVVEIAPASYRHERGVEVRLPFVHKQF